MAASVTGPFVRTATMSGANSPSPNSLTSRSYAWRDGTLVFKQVTFPEWWLYSFIAFCGALLVIEFVRLIAKTLRGEDTLAHRQATA